MSLNKDTDVVVIGGGVIGCAVAYYLAKRGARVTVVERFQIGNGSSAANTGSINMATKKPGDAQSNPFLVTQAFADAARNRGVRIMTGTELRTIETAAGRVSGVNTSKGALRADWVVNAAGAHAATIGKMAGAVHDVRPWRG